MTVKKFIEDQSQVKIKLTNLKLIQKETDEFEEIYLDSLTEEKWEKYDFEFEDQVSYGIGLRRIPYPTIDETIEIALTSNYNDEVSGASALLFEFDRQGLEIRDSILQRLEDNISNISIDRFDTIYWRTEIYDKTNNRETFGKSLEEIEKDSQHYISTSNRAKELKNKITTANKD